jgi:DNA-binding SARP family transcriptional activator/tetratricopeptide (TPR) repeat protein
VAYLALALLGPFQATLDDLPIEGLRSDWRRALLAYLAVESGREHRREQVASLLWPERPDREALSALRYALSNLRSTLGDRRSAGDRRTASPFLLVTRTSVQFNPDSNHWLDVAEFQERSSRSDLAGLERAASLYRGPFLDGLSVRDSPAFDEWMLLKGEEARRRMLSVLGRLTSLQMARAEYAGAARWAQRQLELEPYREQAHRQLMVALALGGERSAALAHYEACRQLLAQELGCEPEDETRALCTQIRDGGLSQPWSQPPASPAILATAPPTEPPSRFVARQEELARLKTLLDRALAGHGGVALIAGEPGSGKTALLDEFARLAGQAHGNLLVLRGSCNAHAGAGDPYLPFREILQTLAGDVEHKRAGGTLSLDQARRAWEALPAVGATLVEHGPDLIDTFVPGEALLRRIEGFPSPQTGRAPGAARWLPRLRDLVRHAAKVAVPTAGPGVAPPQPDLFAQVTQVLHTVSMDSPLLLTIDDLQWADSGTAALLFHLGRRLAGSRILLVCAYRPEALQDPLDPKRLPRPLGSVLQELMREWGNIRVDLDRADGRVFVDAYVDSEPNCLGEAFRQTLYDHTAGNPLFTVELLRSFERKGALVQDAAGRWVEAAGLDWARSPSKVEAVIAGHLASLTDEDRVLLQAASVQGEQFTAEVVARVLGWDEEAAVQRLSGPLRTRHRLVEAVSLDRLGSSSQSLSRYRFRHALVQGNVYHSLDAVQRVRLHETTGQALEAIYALQPSAGPPPAGQAEGKPPTTEALRHALAPDLARHFETAGMPLQAARHRLEAARWSMRLVAHDEAITHLERGLALLEGIPASRERLRLELALCLTLVNPVVLQQGFQSATLKRALARLFELGQHPDLKDEPQRLTALVLLGLASSWSADPERGQRVGEQLLKKAPSVGSEQAQDGGQPFLMLAHWVLGHSCLLQGQLVAAREHLGQALALHDPVASQPLGLLFPGEPGVIGRVELGYALWLLGYPDQGRGSLRQALALAQEIDQPRTTVFAHVLVGMLYALLGRDGAEALKHAQALQALGEAGQIYLAWTELLAGQAGAAAPRSEHDQGLAQAQAAESAVQGMGSGAGHVMQLLFQAQTHLQAGQAAMALEAVDQALAWIEHTGVQLLEAEVWRVRGELLLGAEGAAHLAGALHLDVAAEAEACFRRALEVAREQQARWLELRASVSLARLWGSQGRHHQARDLLAEVYGWFTEGFDTVDLVEAKALLDELA